jgi:hypothetical protein
MAAIPWLESAEPNGVMTLLCRRPWLKLLELLGPARFECLLLGWSLFAEIDAANRCYVQVRV